MSSMARTSIYRLADLYGIKVCYRDIHGSRPDIDGYACTRHGLIYLDWSIKGTRQAKCVADEEVGHCLNPPIANHITFHSNRYWQLSHDERDNLRVLAAKDERAARKWATGFEIPDRDFWAFAADGPREWRDWLERFEVTDWFMEEKVGFMRVQRHFKWREMVIREGALYG